MPNNCEIILPRIIKYPSRFDKTSETSHISRRIIITSDSKCHYIRILVTYIGLLCLPLKNKKVRCRKYLLHAGFLLGLLFNAKDGFRRTTQRYIS
jgi:hypothetical protein